MRRAVFSNHVLDRLASAIDSLSQLPHRQLPPGVDRTGDREYRQTSFKPYRLIYRVTEASVVVHLIADGRRDMQSLLTRRLLGA